MSGMRWTGSSFSAMVLIFLTALALTLSPTMTQAADDSELRAAPLSAEFENFVRESASTARETKSSGGHSLGYTPSPVDLSSVNKGPFLSSEEAAAGFPSRYDLRTLQRVSPVRDQGPCGSCWTFGALASMESCLLKQGQTWDFSEADMNQNHGFDDRVCDGGNYFMATAYLARWGGPFAEATYPYPFVRIPPTQTTTMPCVKKHLQEAIFLPERESPLDNDALKWAIRSFGAVGISYYEDEGWFNGVDSYYCAEYNTSNHAVAVVGWDDDYSASKFKTRPPGNGAFIVKNSWGTEWGDEGYFYMSYYDKNVKNFTVFNGIATRLNFKTVYQYDPQGWTISAGFNKNTAWMANVFMARPGASKIMAASFYSPERNCSYDLYIYNNVSIDFEKRYGNSPTKGKLVFSLTNQTISYAGYHTVKLPNAVSVAPYRLFSVVVKLKTPNSSQPIAIECPIRLGPTPKSYASGANAFSGQSFVSANPGTKGWRDLTTLVDTSDVINYLKANVCLKAFGN
ncbi:MAG: lectin like domain-containing protein [Syntrophobacteraceae bacterium]